MSLHLLVQMEAEVSRGSCTVNHRGKTMLPFAAWCSYGCIFFGAEIEVRVGPSPLMSSEVICSNLLLRAGQLQSGFQFRLRSRFHFRMPDSNSQGLGDVLSKFVFF